jgi:Ca2+-binding EF-hand superfamily protein
MQTAYQEAFDMFVKDIKNFCTTHDVGYIFTPTDKAIENALFGELFKAGIMS